MARYDLPTYVLHVLGHFWMFAVKITEWIFSLKSLGLWTWTWTHLPIVWDKVPNKPGFCFTPSLIVMMTSKWFSLYYPSKWFRWNESLLSPALQKALAWTLEQPSMKKNYDHWMSIFLFVTHFSQGRSIKVMIKDVNLLSDSICMSSVPRLHGPQKRVEWQEGDSQRAVATFLKGDCPK